MDKRRNKQRSTCGKSKCCLFTTRAFLSPSLSCFSAIGRQGGQQRISVGEGCEYKGTVMHEMMHALGFFHEQSRTDRDNYIMVLWWNIEPGNYYKLTLHCHNNLINIH